MLSPKEQSRIQMLRDKAVQPVVTYAANNYFFYKRMQELGQKGRLEERVANATSYAMDQLTPCIDDGELIVGKCIAELDDVKLQEWEALKQYVQDNYSMNGQSSHMTVDYDLLLSKGLSGIGRIIDEKMQDCTDENKLFFYQSCKSSLEDVIRFSEKYADHAIDLANKENNPERKDELIRIAQVCRRVPKYPAESFHEAVQSVHFVTFCLSLDPLRYHVNDGWHQFQLGRPDRYLWKYYKEDLDNAKITKEHAQVLLDCLSIQINHRVPHGYSSGYMVGGRDKNGTVVANDLTEMCMQVIDDIRLVYPSVGLCYTKDMPDRFLKRACEILSHGRSHPAIFNDDLISDGLKLYGVPEEEAHDYIHSTCVEITPISSSNVWVASPYHNLVKPLLESMNREYDNMDEFIDAIFDKLDHSIQQGYEYQCKVRKMREANYIWPLLSCLVNDCLDRGIDIERGGGRYNWIMPSFVGMANLIDCLSVIEKMVFEEKKYTMTDLKKLADCNFENCELQRLELLNKIPKYGNDNDTVDRWGIIITEHIVEECKKYTGVFSNANLVPSVFCWIMHTLMGSETGATPDGRLAGFPLGDGSGAAQGREKNGPTASILSSTKWSHKEFIGGVAVNLKFAKTIFESEDYEKMMSMIKTYIVRGGLEVQINVVNRATLLDARKNPEQYKDLVVRIGGYSDYFVTLSDSMQEEVLLRTEHEL